jgi:cytochrome c6
MKIMKLIIVIAMIAIALFLILPNLSWAANEGAALYQSKCAICHGADLAGKPAAKIPSLISADAKQLSDADLTDAIGHGGKDKRASQAFANKGLPPDQVQMVVTYIRESQKNVASPGRARVYTCRDGAEKDEGLLAPQVRLDIAVPRANRRLSTAAVGC